MNKAWPTVPLGEILIERRDVPSEKDLLSGHIRIVEKISFDSGKIQFRTSGESKTGMILICPGDIVVSGINAAKGAIAIYSEMETRPAAATIHYGSYIPKRDVVNPQFLWWMLRSKFFRDLLLEYVPGGIKTELKAKRLLPIPVPIPSVAEQNQLLERIDNFTNKINEACDLRSKSAEIADALIRSTLYQISQRLSVNGKLEDALTSAPRNGWSARCDNAENGIPVLSLSSVTGFHYRASKFKRTSLAASEKGHFWLKQGDLLITRSNTPELVGHAAIYDGTPTPCIYPDLIMRLETKDNSFDRRFVWYWLQSPIARDFIVKHAKGTSPTMKKISQGIVKNIPFPSTVSLAEQQNIVAELDVMQKKVTTLKQLQAETAVELNTLMPSILDRAFRGEL